MLRILIVSILGLITIAGAASNSPVTSLQHQVDGTEYTADRSGWPPPPQLPDNFTWVGRYVVPDLGIDVPFTWNGSGGNFQMTAGGEDHPIHFTNVLYDGELYTLTYTWPDIPRQACSHVGPFTIEELNEGFADASFAGRETLHGEVDREVNHFRSVGVVDLPSSLIPGMDNDLPLRIPLMAGDIYTDVDNPEQISQLLHFGLQNLYDPNLDEWIIIDQASEEPGEVLLPDECTIGGSKYQLMGLRNLMPRV